jgi:nickel transport protein
MRTILLVVLALVFIGDPGAVLAHRVTVFAWVEGETVHTESMYSGGRPVKGGTIRVFDNKGEMIIEGRTDEKGRFSFDVPGPLDLKVVLEASPGHRANWLIKAREFMEGEQMQSAQSGPLTTQPPVKQESPTGYSDCPGMEEILDEALKRRLEPIERMLRESQHRGPSIHDVMAGIGYIVGLMGVAAYLSSRKGK